MFCEKVVALSVRKQVRNELETYSLGLRCLHPADSGFKSLYLMSTTRGFSLEHKARKSLRPQVRSKLPPAFFTHESLCTACLSLLVCDSHCYNWSMGWGKCGHKSKEPSIHHRSRTHIIDCRTLRHLGSKAPQASISHQCFGQEKGPNKSIVHSHN